MQTSALKALFCYLLFLRLKNMLDGASLSRPTKAIHCTTQPQMLLARFWCDFDSQIRYLV
jgi:hypothetical protein